MNFKTSKDHEEPTVAEKRKRDLVDNQKRPAAKAHRIAEEARHGQGDSLNDRQFSQTNSTAPHGERNFEASEESDERRRNLTLCEPLTQTLTPRHLTNNSTGISLSLDPLSMKLRDRLSPSNDALTLLQGTCESSDPGAAVAQRVRALVAQQQLHTAQAVAQLRHHALLFQSATRNEHVLGMSTVPDNSSILANLHAMNPVNAVNQALLFPRASLPGVAPPLLPSLSISRQAPLEPSRLLGTQWNPTGNVSTASKSMEKQGHPPVDLYMRCDEDLLSDHQILLRRQIEYFEAGQQEVQSITHGRRREIQVGQVGIRCKHCAVLPNRNRPKGSVYYPASLRALYQAAQNMAASHFSNSCEMIGRDLKEQFRLLQGAKASAGHGGKRYWSDCARAVGIVETDKCLVFKTSQTTDTIIDRNEV